MKVVCALVVTLFLAACAGRTELVQQGIAEVGDMRVPVTSGWNRLPSSNLSWARLDSEVWTVHGVSLDRLVLIPGIENGEAIYREQANRLNPPYRVGMQGGDLADLLVASIEDAQGPNTTIEVTSEIIHRGFDSNVGIEFEFSVAVLDGPPYRGIATMVRQQERLYVAYFLAAEPHYYDMLIGHGRQSVLGVTF